MWCKNMGTRFFRFVTMHAFDRQTDGQMNVRTERHSQYRALYYMHGRNRKKMTNKIQKKLEKVAIAMHIT